ncbi:MAG: hypothetical protein GKR93_11955 [Gammaproteobacteria bacterium]|nr:hypothetical protein [Gammaproteobacteria bacterium]
MPIVAGDIDFHLSGGAANAVPDAALGGAISSVEIVAATVSNLFDVVDGDEADAGDTEYRCFYVKNNHGSLTLQGAEVWVQTETPSVDTDEEIGLGTSAVNGIEQTIADESTAPAGVVFSQANGEGSSLAIGDIPAGEHKAIWVKRVISAAASAVNADASLIRVKGATAA